MAGLGERKKLATRIAIRDAAMELFAQQGFTGTTIDQIAEAANVSRATVFSYFPTKEEIVHGDGAAAIGLLATRLGEREDGETTVTVVRAWLDQLAGWFEPELVLQQRLAREVPLVGARKLQLYGEAERAVADALAAELGAEQQLAARLAAAAWWPGSARRRGDRRRPDGARGACAHGAGDRAPARRRRRLRRGGHRGDRRGAARPLLNGGIEGSTGRHGKEARTTSSETPEIRPTRRLPRSALSTSSWRLALDVIPVPPPQCRR
jgi:AcrR family transcriptional regulator